MGKVKSISSRQNAWFQRFRDAARDHAEEIVIEGPKAVADAIAGGWRAVAVAGDSPHATLHFSENLLNSLSDTRTSQGVIALFERPSFSARDIFAKRDTIVVALDGVQDPGNVGTIVRLAAAFDAAGIALLPGSADPLSPKAIRASAGAILTVPFANVSHEELLATDLLLFAADARGTTADPPARGAVLVFGSEGAGVSPALRDRVQAIAIPTSGRVESLNVAAAAAILLSRSYRMR